jgi:hypothetical protein
VKLTITHTSHLHLLCVLAVTSLDFPKYHAVHALLKDLKGGFLQTVDTKTLWNGGSVQKACQPYFTRLMQQSVNSCRGSCM